jgi:coproporphyrinogen III oxidase
LKRRHKIEGGGGLRRVDLGELEGKVGMNTIRICGKSSEKYYKHIYKRQSQPSWSSLSCGMVIL